MKSNMTATNNKEVIKSEAGYCITMTYKITNKELDRRRLKLEIDTTDPLPKDFINKLHDLVSKTVKKNETNT